MKEINTIERTQGVKSTINLVAIIQFTPTTPFHSLIFNNFRCIQRRMSSQAAPSVQAFGRKVSLCLRRFKVELEN